MDEIVGIVSQLKASFEGEAWHGPAVLELLNGVAAAQAAARPVPGAHTIWELVFHIAAWESAAERRLHGGSGEVPLEQDFPVGGDVSEDSWRRLRDALRAQHSALLAATGTFPRSRLAEIVPGTTYTFYKLLHGVVEHNLYHAGQIALLKKAVGA